MMSYIIIIKVKKFYQSTRSSFGTAGKKTLSSLNRVKYQKNKTGVIVAMFLHILYSLNIAINIAILAHQFHPRPSSFPSFANNVKQAKILLLFLAAIVKSQPDLYQLLLFSRIGY